MAETDSSGALAQTHHQDAFGNTQASWSTGLWGGDKPGWHHNTKEYDADIGIVYMYSRFYNAETGTFASRAPYPPMMEHAYSFADQYPVLEADPRGSLSFYAFTPCTFWENQECYVECANMGWVYNGCVVLVRADFDGTSFKPKGGSEKVYCFCIDPKAAPPPCNVILDWLKDKIKPYL